MMWLPLSRLPFKALFAIVHLFSHYTVYHSSVRSSLLIVKRWSSVALLGVLGVSAIVAEQASTGHADKERLDARISRIEHRLMPAAIIRGQALPAMTLTDRMKHLQRPGRKHCVFRPWTSRVGTRLWPCGHGGE